MNIWVGKHQLCLCFIMPPSLLPGWLTFIDVEGQLYTLLYAMLHRRLEHPQVLLSARDPGIDPPWIWRGSWTLGVIKSHIWIFDSMGISTPTPHIFQGSTVYILVITYFASCFVPYCVNNSWILASTHETIMSAHSQWDSM